ncbi:hypothetical protein ON010_g639 [Phytophthora cinnamomi]|nr:hypothetical protein ON010_g639 [Phytophthora cinnamomi]
MPFGTNILDPSERRMVCSLSTQNGKRNKSGTDHCESGENGDQLDTKEPHDEQEPHERVGEEEDIEDLDQDEHHAHELDGLGDDEDPSVVVRRIAVPFEVPDADLSNKQNKAESESLHCCLKSCHIAVHWLRLCVGQRCPSPAAPPPCSSGIASPRPPRCPDPGCIGPPHRAPAPGTRPTTAGSAPHALVEPRADGVKHHLDHGPGQQERGQRRQQRQAHAPEDERDHRSGPTKGIREKRIVLNFPPRKINYVIYCRNPPKKYCTLWQGRVGAESSERQSRTELSSASR